MIRVENLQKVFGEKEVLRNIDLKILKGEIFAFIGPSGAGKTTLLRLLNFFEIPEKGNIRFRGMNSDIINIRRRMSLLFQTPAIFNNSVFENVAYGLKVRGIDKKIIDKKVGDALNIVGLPGIEKQNARTLSGGEAQRMAFARAIVYDPQVLLLDEPTANLDPANVMKIEEIIKRIRNERGTTIVLATHNIPQVRRIADRVGILLNGELIEVNSKVGIFSKPRDARSEAFINGEMIY
ncbi:MAG: phosphate ABC transporter ATP-binding protein [Candidatus Methanoperedenaceae archaeon]|nr:MAG: phosphate ABC transporter ATP-binding protein [Candidatus Methanoperedenaceae archaeon]